MVFVLWLYWILRLIVASLRLDFERRTGPEQLVGDSGPGEYRAEVAVFFIAHPVISLLRVVGVENGGQQRRDSQFARSDQLRQDQ